MPAAWREGGRVHGGYVPRAADDDGYPLGDDGPLFFLSYAHGPRDDRSGRDPDLWIAQLYDDLCDHIKSLADLPPTQKAGFMDRELRQGHEWPERLSNALATCRVFVPLYSRRDFKSEHCGKEWFAFNRGRLKHNAKKTSPVETTLRPRGRGIAPGRARRQRTVRVAALRVRRPGRDGSR